MNTSKSYLKLTSEEKINLINRSLEGEYVSKICKEAGISRTIFYRWLKEYSTKSALSGTKQNLSEKYPLFGEKTRKKHPRKLSSNKEREIVRLWLENPTYSIREIAKISRISTGGAWNVIGEYKQKVEDRGVKTIKRHLKKSYKIFSEGQKIDMIKRYYGGDPIVRIARESGVSRTIFYKWLKEYGESKDLAFMSKRRRGEAHWRFMPEVQDLAIEIAMESPKLSLSEIVIRIKDEGHNISKSGLYYILKRMNLSSYEDRLAYVPAVEFSGTQRGGLIERRRELITRISSAIPQFAVYTLFGFLIALAFTFSINEPKKTDKFSNINITVDKEQISEEKQGNYPGNEQNVSGKANEPQLSGAQQDFRWGALAINSPQSIIITGNGVRLGFGVVDHAGNTICDAIISVEQPNPSGTNMSSLSSRKGEISQSGGCSIRSVTNTPDYSANISSFDRAGIYKLRIKASTYDGEKEFDSKLIVEDRVPYEIERTSYPTRVYPVSTYPISIVVKANNNFSGNISENLPKGITASKISDRGVLFKNDKRNERTIKWKVNLKKGQIYKISYSLHFPQVWPEFYEIGPLKFTANKTGKLVFQESRYWQVVADAAE